MEYQQRRQGIDRLSLDKEETHDKNPGFGRGSFYELEVKRPTRSTGGWAVSGPQNPGPEFGPGYVGGLGGGRPLRQFCKVS